MILYFSQWFSLKFLLSYIEIFCATLPSVLPHNFVNMFYKMISPSLTRLDQLGMPHIREWNFFSYFIYQFNFVLYKYQLITIQNFYILIITKLLSKKNHHLLFLMWNYFYWGSALIQNHIYIGVNITPIKYKFQLSLG